MNIPNSQQQGPAPLVDERTEPAGDTAQPRSDKPLCRIVLHAIDDDRGKSSESAELGADGTLRVTGWALGPLVSELFGEGIDSYDWVYSVSADRVPDLVNALGGVSGDDVLNLLAAHYEQVHGQIYHLLTGPMVGATFSNWCTD